MTREAKNMSTEYQPKGSGKNPSDTLDRAADSQDYLNGGDGTERKRRRINKMDSATARIDDQGCPHPDADGDV